MAQSDTPTDIQCQTISDGLDALAELVKDPLAQEALDVGHSLQVADALELMRRLQRSLRQYIERKGDLYYIGFTGHFSSGKSSTINSLLSIWNTPNARTVDLNPTDTDVTLITHPENFQSLLGVVREGRIAIRPRPIEAALLTSAVIADTPGTGDPLLVQEIARQFLPLCDLVLFFFSAASPFDITDLPLLKELRSRLPFIPLKFVVTRGDEFRRDRGKPLDESNLDDQRLQVFLVQVRSRLAGVLGAVGLDAGEFFVLDNPSGFGVERLRRFISEASDQANTAARIQMHGHKIQFFRTSAAECHSVLAGRLKGQFEDIRTIVNTARRNVAKFQECVRLASLEITKRWGEELQRQQDAARLEASRVLPVSALPDRASHTPSVLNVREQCLKDIRKDAENKAARLARAVARAATSQLDLYVAAFQSQIPDVDVRQPDKRLLSAKRPSSVDLEQSDFELAYLSFDDAADRVRTSVIAAVADTKHRLTRACESFLGVLGDTSFITLAENSVKGTSAVLELELERYFQFVLIYHTGVFARQAKDAISRAGLGQHLDALEHEISPEEQRIIQGESRLALLGHLEESITAFKSSVSVIAGEATDLCEKVSAFSVGGPVSQVDQQAALAMAQDQHRKLAAEIAQKLDGDLESFVTESEVALGNKLIEITGRYSEKAAEMKAIRHRHFLWLTLGGGALGLVAFAVYFYAKGPVVNTTGVVLLLGAASSILGNAVGYIMAKLTDRFPQSSGELAENWSKKLRIQCREVLDELRKGHVRLAINEGEIAARMVKLGSASLDGNLAKHEEDFGSAAFDALRSMRAYYEGLRSRFIALIETTTAAATEDLGQPEVTTAKLRDIAAKIRDQEISPSFDLLDQTERRYRLVQDNLARIRF